MSNTNTGGPAFPTPSGWDSQGNWCRNYTDSEGMTLRDYFAAKAMQGMLADPNTPEIMDIAGAAYEVADAMLKARQA
jgi:hypothetical protein